MSAIRTNTEVEAISITTLYLFDVDDEVDESILRTWVAEHGVVGAGAVVVPHPRSHDSTARLAPLAERISAARRRAALAGARRLVGGRSRAPSGRPRLRDLVRGDPRNPSSSEAANPRRDARPGHGSSSPDRPSLLRLSALGPVRPTTATPPALAAFVARQALLALERAEYRIRGRGTRFRASCARISGGSAAFSRRGERSPTSSVRPRDEVWAEVERVPRRDGDGLQPVVPRPDGPSRQAGQATGIRRRDRLRRRLSSSDVRGTLATLPGGDPAVAQVELSTRSSSPSRCTRTACRRRTRSPASTWRSGPSARSSGGPGESSSVADIDGRPGLSVGAPRVPGVPRREALHARVVHRGDAVAHGQARPARCSGCCVTSPTRVGKVGTDDVAMMPVSIVYDQLRRGRRVRRPRRPARQKKAESIGWVVKFTQVAAQARHSAGSTCGSASRSRCATRWRTTWPTTERRRCPTTTSACRSSRFEVCTRINAVTPITASALDVHGAAARPAAGRCPPESCTRRRPAARAGPRPRPPAGGVGRIAVETRTACAIVESLRENGTIEVYDAGDEPVYLVESGTTSPPPSTATRSSTTSSAVRSAELAPGPRGRARRPARLDRVDAFWAEAVPHSAICSKFDFFFERPRAFRESLAARVPRAAAGLGGAARSTASIRRPARQDAAAQRVRRAASVRRGVPRRRPRPACDEPPSSRVRPARPSPSGASRSAAVGAARTGSAALRRCRGTCSSRQSSSPSTAGSRAPARRTEPTPPPVIPRRTRRTSPAASTSSRSAPTTRSAARSPTARVSRRVGSLVNPSRRACR